MAERLMMDQEESAEAAGTARLHRDFASAFPELLKNHSRTVKEVCGVGDLKRKISDAPTESKVRRWSSEEARRQIETAAGKELGEGRSELALKVTEFVEKVSSGAVSKFERGYNSSLERVGEKCQNLVNGILPSLNVQARDVASKKFFSLESNLRLEISQEIDRRVKLKFDEDYAPRLDGQGSSLANNTSELERLSSSLAALSSLPRDLDSAEDKIDDLEKSLGNVSRLSRDLEDVERRVGSLESPGADPWKTSEALESMRSAVLKEVNDRANRTLGEMMRNFEKTFRAEQKLSLLEDRIGDKCKGVPSPSSLARLS